ncbi:rod shape-determining protein MreD [Myxococcota bacterium]|nr:rod shape-determining protein MreD [Myxococcota bacterium]
MRSVWFLLLLVLIQVLVGPLLLWTGLRPTLLDVPLVAVCHLCYAFPTRQGFLTTLAAGLILDLSTPGTLLGMHVEILGLLFLLIRGLSGRLPLDRPLPLILVTLVAGVLKTLLFFLLSLLFDSGFEGRAGSLLWAIPTVLTTALLAPLLVLPFAGLDVLTGGLRKADRRIL